MPVRLFTCRVHDTQALAELNAFLASNLVASMEHYLVRADTDPAVVFVINWPLHVL